MTTVPATAGEGARSSARASSTAPASSEARTLPAPGVWGPAIALTRRELVRFFRQKGRVIGAMGTPVFIWLFLGFGLGDTFRTAGPGGDGYLAYFFPGMIAMVVLFTAIFSAISVIQDRTEGFLQGVLAAPVPRVSVALGKILGATAIAWLQGVVVLALAPLAHVPFHLGGFLLAALVIAIMAFGLSALGFLFAWGSDSVQSFHSIMNLVLFPLWLLSGAFFPPRGWLGLVMGLNPLTHSLSALRQSLYLGAPEHAGGLGSIAVGIVVSVGFAAACLGLSAWRVSRPES